MSAIPVPYTSGQTIYGHYSAAQFSYTTGIPATPTALDVHASIRNGSSVIVGLTRIKIGWSVLTAVTAAVRMAYQASIVRGFTVDFTTNSTAVNMSTTAYTNQMRKFMTPSQLGANGPRAFTPGSSLTTMGGQNCTIDAAPFAITNWNVPSILTGTVSFPLGVAGNTQTLYEWTGLGQHPVLLGNNEGVIIQLVHTGWASGTITLYTQWEWFECAAF